MKAEAGALRLTRQALAGGHSAEYGGLIAASAQQALMDAVAYDLAEAAAKAAGTDQSQPAPAGGAQQQSGSTERITVTFLGAVQIPEQVVEKAADIAEEGLEKVESNPAVASNIEELTEEAKGLYPKLANKVDQLHHVIPKYLGGAKDGLLVKLPAAYHQMITNAIRSLAPYGNKVQRSQQEVHDILQKVYEKFPLL